MSDNDKTQITGSQTIHNVAQFHGFEIVRLISNKGGMADVYEAFQSSVGRRVAAKKLKPGFINDENIKNRFEEEAKLLGQLNHANIVQVIDFSNEHLTLFMEFIEGRPLDDILSEKEKLPLDESLRIISAVLAGLHYAHGHSIIHRDIKPGNIFLAADGRVKIADFGIARILGGSTQVHQTQHGSWIGTPSYISPEQILGDEVGPWSDIYSAGVTLYFLVTGKLPFVGENIMQTAVMHLKEDPVPPQQIDPLISSELNRIILKAMAKSREERFPTALAFKDAVDRLLYPRKDMAYLREAKTEWEKSRQERTTERKLLLLNSIKLSQMALAENRDLAEARQILDDSRNGLKKIRRKEYIILGSTALIIVAVIVSLILQLSKGAGTLDIFTSEAAEVFLDGVKIGTAPFIFQDIPSGRHKIAVEQPGFYRSAERDIVIVKGKLLTINEVIPSGGTVIISSARPGMTVKIDGRDCGQTPLSKKLIIGSHSIEVGGMTHQVLIQENDNLAVKF
jgi:eukaryotic-like serine/threonine-protein kinase